MTTITINERTAKGKSLLDFLTKFEGESFVKIIKEESSYDKKFVDKVLKSDKEARAGKVHKINTDDLWK